MDSFGGKMVDENQQLIIPQSPQSFNQPIQEQPKPKNKLWIIILIILLILIAAGLVYYFLFYNNKTTNPEMSCTTTVELPAGQIRASSELQGLNTYCQSIENNICKIDYTKFFQYCQQNPSTMDCISSSYCEQNPNLENCKKLNTCLNNPSDKSCQTNVMKNQTRAKQNSIDSQVKAAMSELTADAMLCKDDNGNIQTKAVSAGFSCKKSTPLAGEVIAGTNLCSKTTSISKAWPEMPTGFSNKVYISNGDKDSWIITTKLLSCKNFECSSSGCSEK